MPSPTRFFVPRDAIEGDAVTLPPEDAHHARSVLRLRTGERIVVHDGEGGMHDSILTEVSGTRVVARIATSAPCNTEPRTRITVAQALPKNADKMEQVLQHGTEVGAAAFIVFPSARSVARLPDDKAEKRLQRWRGIVKSAAQQSGRGRLPTVTWAASVAEIAERMASFEAALIAHETASLPLGRALAGVPGPATKLLVLIGPEGGLTDDEAARFTAAGGVPVSLGPRILRTETAALVSLAQTLFARDEPP